MMALRTLMALWVAVVCGLLQAAVDYPVSTVPTPTRGAWCSDYAATRAYAERRHLPMLLFVAHHGCDHCSLLEKAVNTRAFNAWRAEQKLAMCFVYDDVNNAAKLFARDAPNQLTTFPFIKIYWPKADGTVVTENFTGANAEMPVMSSAAKYYTLTEQLMYSVELSLKGWDPDFYDGGVFAVGDTVGDRLEAEAGYTAWVDVPLMRDAGCAAVAVTNVLSCTYPDSRVETREVVWPVGSTSQYVRVSMDAGWTSGSQIRLVISDVDGEVAYTNAIAVVETENSPKNPVWKGVKTADELSWGEWTMDLAAAQAKVAAYGGTAYTLVQIGGSVWCPDCVRTEANLFNRPEFKTWAADRHVACVVVDIPTNPSEGGASLLTRTPKEVSSRYITATTPNQAAIQSGAGYLSRWMISDAEAKATEQEFADLAKNFYRRPEWPNQNRPGVPTLVLLRGDGTICGRIAAFSSDSPSAFMPGYIDRLDELLDTVSDNAEEANAHWGTTTQTVGLGDVAEGTISGGDLIDVMRLEGWSTDKLTKVVASGTAPAGLETTLSLLQVVDGVAETVSTVTGTLAGGLAVEAFLAEGAQAYVQIEVAGLAATAVAYGRDGDTTSSYSLSASTVVVPEEKAVSLQVDGTFAVRLVKDEIYRVTGISASENAGVLQPVEGTADRYTALVAGDVSIAASGMVEIQLWHPGEVAFVATAASFFSPSGAGVVRVVRRNGVSGQARVRVVLDAAASTAVNGERYSWTDAEVVWADGEYGEKSVTVPLREKGDTSTDEYFVVRLEDQSDGLVAVSSDSMRIVVFDTSDPCFENDVFTCDVFTGLAVSEAVSLFNVGGGRVQLKVTGKQPSGMKAVYDAASGEVRLTGIPSKGGTYTFSIMATVNGRKGIPATFTVNVADPRAVNAHVGVTRAKQEFPLLDAETGVVGGLLQLAVSSKNKITAKYQGDGVKSVSFSGNWASLDTTTGVVAAELVARTGETLRLEMDRDARIAAELSDVSSRFAGPFRGVAGELSSSFTGYVGSYNVTLPTADTTTARVEPTGTGFLTLKVAADGKVKWSGVLADGVAVSGSSRLMEAGDGFAEMAAFKVVKKDVFGALLRIETGAAGKWRDSNTAQVIHAVDGVSAYLLHQENGFDYLEILRVYGSYFEPKTAPTTFCTVFGYNPNDITLSFGDSLMPEAGGALVPMEAVQLYATDKKFVPTEQSKSFKIAFAPMTGIFNGSAVLSFAGGRTVKGTFKGVLMPGWYDCGCNDLTNLENRPFGSGTFWFKDTVNGVSVTRSMFVDLVTKAADGY